MKKKKKKEKKNLNKIQETKIRAIRYFPAGIICGSGSFAVQFGDHFRSGDHLRSGIICGAVQALALDLRTSALYPPPTHADILTKILATPTLYRRVNEVTHF